MEATGAGDGRLAELRGSARGWHGAQLAALGFIGLCGVLQQAGSADAPRFLQVAAGLLVLLALLLSCLATALVASVAWPIQTAAGPGDGGRTDEEQLARGGRRLRTGVVTTFLAVAILALAATSSWWPHTSTASSLVELSTAGGVACGSLGESEPGQVELTVAGRKVVVPLSDVVRLRAVASCG